MKCCYLLDSHYCLLVEIPHLTRWSRYCSQDLSGRLCQTLTFCRGIDSQWHEMDLIRNRTCIYMLASGLQEAPSFTRHIQHVPHGTCKLPISSVACAEMAWHLFRIPPHCRFSEVPSWSAKSRQDKRLVSKLPQTQDKRDGDKATNVGVTWPMLILTLAGKSQVSTQRRLSLSESNVYWTVYHCNSWRMKNQLDVTCYFISLIMRSTCFGH